MSKRFNKVDAKSVLTDSVAIAGGTAITSVDTDISSTSASDDTLASAKAVKAYVDGKPGYNYIINGGMRVSQRGDFTSATAVSNGLYYLDRWKGSLSVASDLLHTATSSDTEYPGLGSVKLTRTSGTADGAMGWLQKLEDFALFKGKTATISIRVKTNNSNLRIGFGDGVVNSFSDPATNTETWQTISITKTISSSATLIQIYPRFQGSAGADVAIAVNDYFEMGAVKLEIGSVATPFVPRLIGEELALCQRYYYRVGGGSFGIVGNGTHWGGASWTNFKLPVTMRDNPSVTYLGALSDFQIRYAVTNVTPTNLSIGAQFTAPDKGKFVDLVFTSTTPTDGQATLLYHWTANGIIEFKAEL